MSRRKRTFDASISYDRPTKVPRLSSPHKNIATRPSIKHARHPDSGIGKNFHSVPYPLSLLPLQSWQGFHQSDVPMVPDGRIVQFICSWCRKPRPDLSAYQRKLFLVAERLSWEEGTVSAPERALNEERLWEANAELGIFEPAVEGENQVLGGEKSRANKWHPYKNEHEANVTLQLIEKAEVLSEENWRFWRDVTIRAIRSPPVLISGLEASLQQQQYEPAGASKSVTGPAQQVSASQPVLFKLGRRTAADPQSRSLVEVVSNSTGTMDQFNAFECLESQIGAQIDREIASMLVVHANAVAETRPLQTALSSGAATPEQTLRNQGWIDGVIRAVAANMGFDGIRNQGRDRHGAVAGNGTPSNKATSKERASTIPALPTPPSSAQKIEDGEKESISALSYHTLPEFYSLFDKIERTSFMGA